MIINTGSPRSIVGHAISGGIVSLMASGALNYSKYKKGQIEKQDAIKDTLKKTTQGAILSAVAIGASNALGDNNQTPLKSALKAGAFLGLGVAIAYGFAQFQTQEKSITKEESIDSSEDSVVEASLADEIAIKNPVAESIFQEAKQEVEQEAIAQEGEQGTKQEAIAQEGDKNE